MHNMNAIGKWGFGQLPKLYHISKTLNNHHLSSSVNRLGTIQPLPFQTVEAYPLRGMSRSYLRHGRIRYRRNAGNQMVVVMISLYTL